MAHEDGLDAFVRYSSPLAKALGERGFAVKLVEDFEGHDGRFRGIPIGLRALSNDQRVRCMVAAQKFLTEKCGATEYWLEGEIGKLEYDVEAKVQTLALALVEPSAPHDLVAKNADDLRTLLDAQEVSQLFELFVDYIAERSPVSRAKSAEEVEAVIDALGKGTIPASRLTLFDSYTLRSAVHSLAVDRARLTRLNSSLSSPSTEPREPTTSEDS